MAETNNKEKSLAGIIYHDIKVYLKQKKEIRQRKKAENRKIKFRGLFIEKCKKGYHSILAKYYARKEVKTIRQNAELEDVINKKLEHMQKFEEKEAAVNEMEQIRAEQKAAKEAENAQKVAENESAESELDEEVAKIVEQITQEKPIANHEAMQVINPKRVVEETKTEEVVPVVEEPKKEETAVAVVYPNPFEKQGEVAPAVQEGKNDEATTVVELPEQEAEAVVESVSIDDVMANTVATVEEPVQIQTEQVATQAMDAEEQAKLAENVQAILNEEQPEEKTDLDILKKTKELGDSIAQLQQDVAVSLASKQRELNEVKEENNRLTNEVTKAREEIEENERIHNDVVALKDQEINNRDQEIAALRQQLEQERLARVQAENQFRNLAVAIQNVQTMGTEQVQPEIAPQEESFQKRI